MGRSDFLLLQQQRDLEQAAEKTESHQERKRKRKQEQDGAEVDISSTKTGAPQEKKQKKEAKNGKGELRVNSVAKDVGVPEVRKKKKTTTDGSNVVKNDDVSDNAEKPRKKKSRKTESSSGDGGDSVVPPAKHNKHTDVEEQQVAGETDIVAGHNEDAITKNLKRRKKREAADQPVGPRTENVAGEDDISDAKHKDRRREKNNTEPNEETKEEEEKERIRRLAEAFDEKARILAEEAAAAAEAERIRQERADAEFVPWNQREEAGDKRADYSVRINHVPSNATTQDIVEFLGSKAKIDPDQVLEVILPATSDPDAVQIFDRTNPGYCFVSFATPKAMFAAMNVNNLKYRFNGVDHVSIKYSGTHEQRTEHEPKVLKPRPADGDGRMDKAPNKQVYVGNLPYITTEEMLHALFLPAGPIEQTHIAYYKDTKECKGFGFVWFATLEGAANAVRHCIEVPTRHIPDGVMFVPCEGEDVRHLTPTHHGPCIRGSPMDRDIHFGKFYMDNLFNRKLDIMYCNPKPDDGKSHDQQAKQALQELDKEERHLIWRHRYGEKKQAKREGRRYVNKVYDREAIEELKRNHMRQKLKQEPLKIMTRGQRAQAAVDASLKEQEIITEQRHKEIFISDCLNRGLFDRLPRGIVPGAGNGGDKPWTKKWSQQRESDPEKAEGDADAPAFMTGSDEFPRLPRPQSDGPRRWDEFRSGPPRELDFRPPQNADPAMAGINPARVRLLMRG